MLFFFLSQFSPVHWKTNSQSRERPLTYGSIYSLHERGQKGFYMYTNHSYVLALQKVTDLQPNYGALHSSNIASDSTSQL